MLQSDEMASPRGKSKTVGAEDRGSDPTRRVAAHEKLAKHRASKVRSEAASRGGRENATVKGGFKAGAVW